VVLSISAFKILLSVTKPFNPHVFLQNAFDVAVNAVIFNLGFAEPWDFASICQGFHGWLIKKNKNNLACKITSDHVIEVLCTECLVSN